MKRDKDWTDVLRNKLRDVETPPPADGWMRLERALTGAAAPRVSVWRRYRGRVASAAAAVVFCIAAGGYLWYAAPDAGDAVPMVASEAAGSFVGNGEPAVLSADGEETAGIPAKKVPGSAENVAKESGSEKILAVNVPVRRSATQGAKTAPMQAPGDAIPGAEAAAGLEAVLLSDRKNAERSGTAGQDLSEPNGIAVSVGTREAADARDASNREETPAVSENAAKSSAGAYSEKAVGNSGRDRNTRSSVPNAGAENPYYYGDDYVSHASVRKKASFSVYGGGSVTGGSASGVSGEYASDSGIGVGGNIGQTNGDRVSALYYYDRKRSSFRHHQPLSFGLSVRKEFAHGLSLESGVNYTLLRSDVSYWRGGEEFSQKLHFIGVPLRLNWQFLERGRFSLYIGAGGMLEKCVSAKFGTTSVDERGVQWSVLGAAGAQYRLGGIVGLYFEPEVSYYFSDTWLRTSRTDEPLTLTLRLGVRLSF